MDSSRAEEMGRDPIWRLLLRFSAPAIAAMMVASSYNVVDAIFVGRLGPEALAALTIAFPIMMIFHAVAAGTGTGAASLISRRLGAGEREGASRVATVTITLTIILGALMTIICLSNLEALLRLFGASGSVLPPAKSYMSILFSFAILAFFSMTIGAVIRAEGNPVFPSAVMIVTALVNIALDPVLIFGLGPMPAMGVAGAATATVTSQAIGVIIFITYFISGRTSYRFRPSHFLPNLRIIAEIYRIGVASIVRSAASSVVMVLVNRTAASFGVIPLAVLGILFRSSSFVLMPPMGLGMGMLPLIAYNFGAKQIERVGEVIIKALLTSFIWGALCWVVFMLFPNQIISIFNSDSNFLVEGTQALRIFTLVFFIVGMQMNLGVFFQGIGKGLPSLVLALARHVIFLVPALLILPRMFGLTGLWATFPIADILSAMLSLFWAGIQFRKLGIPFRLRYN
jgi:putative MATE family efflux protein